MFSLPRAARCFSSTLAATGVCCFLVAGIARELAAQSLVFTPGLLKMEVFDLSDQEMSDLSLEPLLRHPTFPDLPRETHYIRSFDSTYAYPDQSNDQYGTRIRGLFVPSSSGEYVFYLRSDDASELWFNPGGSSEAGKIRIIQQTGCCNLFGDLPSAPFTLVGGERYYIEALHREGPEYDYCQVAVKRTDNPMDPNYLMPIGPDQIGIFAPEDGVTLTSNPPDTVLGILPKASTDPILLAQEFQGQDGGFAVESFNPQGPWTYSPEGGGVWFATGHRDCSGPENSRLSSPHVTVQQPEQVYLVLRHRYAFQYNGQFVFDGGQIRMSVNRGPYVPLSPSSFLHNGYTGVVQGNNILNGQEAFTGTLRGHQSGFHGTTVAGLGSFNPGDTISLQFVAAWDECFSDTYPDWEIDAVYITHTVAQIAVNARGALPDMGSVPVAHTWQIDTGGGFANLGSLEEVLWLAPRLVHDGSRFRAFLAVPGRTVYTEPVTLQLTREPTCLIGGPYVAECNGDQAGLRVALDAGNSHDPDGGSLTYAWSSGCPGAVFDDPAHPSPTLFFGPSFGSRAGCQVTLTLTNQVGASVTCSTTVDTSLSTVPPTITLNGGDQAFTCSSSSANQYVEPGATATDGCGRSLEVSIGPPADTRRKGAQAVTYDAMDAFGNSAQQVTRMVVVQEAPPQLVDVPGDLVTECRTVGGILSTDPVMAAYLNTPRAVDDCDPDEYVIHDAPSLLPIGTTWVTWQVWDDGATDLTASAMVTVQDTTPPTLNCTALQIPADEAGNAVVPDFRSLLNAGDACTAAQDLTVTQSPAPGTVLPLGRHEITFTATDQATPPNTATCSTTLDVTAVAGDAPEIPGCGAAGCGGNAMLSMVPIWLGLMALRWRHRRTLEPRSPGGR